jgi:hypothetical protein
MHANHETPCVLRKNTRSKSHLPDFYSPRGQKIASPRLWGKARRAHLEKITRRELPQCSRRWAACSPGNTNESSRTACQTSTALQNESKSMRHDYTTRNGCNLLKSEPVHNTPCSYCKIARPNSKRLMRDVELQVLAPK